VKAVGQEGMFMMKLEMRWKNVEIREGNTKEIHSPYA
jgi:hypothetical protein